jgi:hypothetical protein
VTAPMESVSMRVEAPFVLVVCIAGGGFTAVRRNPLCL